MAVTTEEQLAIVKVGHLASQQAVVRERLWAAQTVGLLETEMVAMMVDQLVNLKA